MFLIAEVVVETSHYQVEAGKDYQMGGVRQRLVRSPSVVDMAA
jgi:hypothetical protein